MSPLTQSAAHKIRTKRQNNIASSILSANTEATTAAEEPKSATKRSESRTASLVDTCTTPMSRFRPARDDPLRTIPTGFPTPLANVCVMEMSALRTVLADSLRVFRPVRADSLRTALADFLSSARLLLTRHSFRVCRVPILTLRTIASLSPLYVPSLWARAPIRL